MKIHEIITEETWCQHSMAMDKDGNRCEVPLGVRFCALGWLEKVYGEAFGHERLRLCRIITPDWAPDDVSLSVYNDSHSFEEIKNLFKEADL